MLYGSPMGNSNVHNHKRCPLFLVGHAGGALKGGLHLKAADGTPMANPMLTVLHTLGLDDVKSFGDSTSRDGLEHRAGTDGRGRLNGYRTPDTGYRKSFSPGDSRMVRVKASRKTVWGRLGVVALVAVPALTLAQESRSPASTGSGAQPAQSNRGGRRRPGR